MIWSLKNLIENSEQNQTKTKNGDWVPARPWNYRIWRRWFRKVWLVMTGKADLVIWPGDQ